MSRFYRVTVVLLALVCSLLFSTETFAQDAELHRWRPATGLRTDFITLESGRAEYERGFEFGLWVHYADDPLVVTSGGEQVTRIVGQQLVTHLVGGFSLADRFRLALDVPFYLLQSGDGDPPFGTATDGAGVGDIRVTPKVSLIDGRADGSAGPALALSLPLYLPTGNPDRLQGEAFRLAPTLAFDWRGERDGGVGVNVGMLIRQDSDVVNVERTEQLNFGVAGQIPIIDPLDAVLELNGALPVGAGSVDSEETPLELLGMLRGTPGDVVVSVGGGAGMLEGFGTPDFRVFANIGYSPRERAPVVEEVVVTPTDIDGDGYLDEDDACPQDPEDFDNFEDSDGCPELDNDEDLVLDATDDCPGEDNYVAELVREDHDSFEDTDGCPDPDNDEDEILDVADACPGEDGYVPDEVRENYNGHEDTDGCPDSLAIVRDRIIEIIERVYFDLDSDVIQGRSMPVIDDVARILRDNDYILLVQVEGHTDVRASDAYNLDLSRRRAASVRRALIARGVDEDRLVSEGFGESRLETNDTTDAAHQMNRRVEFNILEQDPLLIDRGGN